MTYDRESRPTIAEIDERALARNYREIAGVAGGPGRVLPVVKSNAYGHGAHRRRAARCAPRARSASRSRPLAEGAELRAAASDGADRRPRRRLSRRARAGRRRSARRRSSGSRRRRGELGAVARSRRPDGARARQGRHRNEPARRGAGRRPIALIRRLHANGGRRRRRSAHALLQRRARRRSRDGAPARDLPRARPRARGGPAAAGDRARGEQRGDARGAATRTSTGSVPAWRSTACTRRPRRAPMRRSHRSCGSSPGSWRCATFPPGRASATARPSSPRARPASRRCRSATPTAIRARSRIAASVVVRGGRAPVAGRVCMDQTMIDVTDVPGVAIGDEVELWGSALPVDEVAARAPGRYRTSCSRGSRGRVPRDRGVRGGGRCARITRALVSVSDKRGLEELARVLTQRRRRDPLDRRDGARARGLGHSGHAVERLHRLARDPRRPREDAAPEDPRRHSRRPRRPAPSRADGASTASARSISSCVNLYPFEAVTARAETTLRRGDREHRHRRPVDGALRGEEPRGRHRGHRPRRLRRGRGGDRARRASVSAATNARLAAKAFALTARYDGAIADYLGGGAWRRRSPPTARFTGVKVQDLRYGENPHQRAAFYRDGDRDRRALARDRAAAAGEGALVQQHRRRQRRARAGEGVRGTDGGRDQAHQPLRRRDRGDARRGVSQGACLGSGVDLRRHRRVQPRARRRDRRRDAGPLPRGRDRAARRRRGARALRRREALAAGPAPDARARRRRGSVRDVPRGVEGRGRPQPRPQEGRSAASCCRTATSPRSTSPPARSRPRAPADARRASRARFRVAHLQARQVERDRPRARRSGDRRRRRSDEPRRRGTARGHACRQRRALDSPARSRRRMRSSRSATAST